MLCKISHRIWTHIPGKYAFYSLQFLHVGYDIFELWRHKPYWDGPQLPTEVQQTYYYAAFTDFRHPVLHVQIIDNATFWGMEYFAFPIPRSKHILTLTLTSKDLDLLYKDW